VLGIQFTLTELQIRDACKSNGISKASVRYLISILHKKDGSVHSVIIINA